MTRLSTLLAAATLALTAGAVRAPAAEPLTVCLESDTPPYSYHEGAKSGGFDLAVAKAVAAHLGRELKVQWYEIAKTPDSDEPDPARAVNAMLHIDKCQLAGGFVFIANDLTPPEDKSRLPDFPRETPDQRKAWVKIGNLISSRPYHYYPFTVLLGPNAADRKIASLDDLQGLRIVSEDGTLADAMLMWYGHRKYFRQIQHVTPAKT
ncbi:MAG: substrate-binding periplasmic protein, partial [Stellaceae bacterium]